ncbi:PrsW family intramembrane metalloprotease [Patescibacteria group bacterium]|nr:PrsW family intramembrane metalloprotease [Patescibacteria group bacterium]MBU4162267.1 PrsW family intramembrane metalloprotease [Patescibacteria group bacterium]
MFQYPIFIILGLVPSIIWLLFYLRKDKRPEPNEMVIKIFIYGMAITLPVALIEWGFVGVLKNFNLPSGVMLAIYFLLGVALVEEVAKYLIIKFRILRDPAFDEPIDAMIYMIIAGLGFAALENILVLFVLKQPELLEKTILTLSGRFIGATFLHALCSANIGFFLALSLIKKKRNTLLFITGLTASIILHGVYNLAITIEGWSKAVIIISMLFGLFLVVLYEFKKVNKLKIYGMRKPL